MASKLETLCQIMRVGIVVRCGAKHAIPDHMQDMNAYSVTLRFRGRQLTVDFFTGYGWDREPGPADVISCLISDTTGYENAGSFADWCHEYGYDTDSRKAERIWRQIEKQAPKVRRLLGEHFDRFAATEH